MTDFLSIGASGIKAYSGAMATISDNIANAQTEGYVRRTIRTEEADASGNSPYFKSKVNPAGVTVSGVTRIVDEWLVGDARVAGGAAEQSTARLEWAEKVEIALNDDATGVGASLTGLFNAADRLASDPANTGKRSAFLQAAGDAAAAFSRSAAALDLATQNITTQAQSGVTQTNTDLTELGQVNDALRRARPGSSNQASLYDERDALLDRISGNLATTSEFDKHGAVTLRLAPPSGDAMISPGNAPAQLSVALQANGSLSFSLTPGSTASFAPGSGRLAGLADAAINVAARGTQLDTIAAQFVADFNAKHQAGTDAAGNAGLPLFSITGSDAATMAIAALSPEQVAVADASGVNGNFLGLTSLRGAGGAENAWGALVAQQSQATASTRAQDAATSTRRDGAQAARAEVSAVNLDHEAAELLRFQQAYEGSARVIQVARETMQTILSLF